MEPKEEATTISTLHLTTKDEQVTHENNIDINVPNDNFNLAYIIYFIQGIGFLLPCNTFITAVDYFHYIYPDRSVDRIFAVVYQSLSLLCLLLIVFCFRKFQAYVRVNVGLGLFLAALLVVPLMDVFYIRGRIRLYCGFYVTVGLVGFSGLSNALVQGGLVGSAAVLPKRYTQAVVSGASASGVIVSLMRIFTKAIFPQNIHGLRKSAILYFTIAIIYMTFCLISYNLLYRLPFVTHHNKIKNEHTLNKAKSSPKNTSVWTVVQKIKWHGLGVTLIFFVTLSIFPGSLTEDVHSKALGSWYPILLITCYNVFDLIGRTLTAHFLLDNANIALGASFARLLFYPLYLGCLHGPRFFRNEVVVASLTSLLGLTTGYFASVLMILAPKMVQKQHSETAAILMVLFLTLGLAIGSVVSWLWII